MHGNKTKMKKKGMARGGASMMKKKGMARGGMKKKGYAYGGATMKKKGMAKGGKAGSKMTLAKLRAEAKKLGYKLVKI
tara:strand:+ start:155 stop:388 length:234 start_codon:yes stop_codon:yes gene_type:complete